MTGTTRLGAAVAAFAAGTTSADTLTTAFAVAPVYAPRPAPPAPPGLLAVGPPGAGRVLVFSSLEQLGRAAGECDWLRTSGRDLLTLVPEGYGVLLDAGCDDALELPTAALHRRPAAALHRRPAAALNRRPAAGAGAA